MPCITQHLVTLVGGLWVVIQMDFGVLHGVEERCCHQCLGVLLFPEGYDHGVGVCVNLVCKEVTGAVPMLHAASPSN